MDYSKPEDRLEERRLRLAELDAIEAGKWPRDTNDYLRWDPLGRFQKPHHGAADLSTYAKKMCLAAIGYIDDLEARLSKGEKPWG